MQFQILFFIGNNMSSFLLINNHCDIVSDIYILICILFHNLCRFVDNTQYLTYSYHQNKCYRSAPFGAVYDSGKPS